MSFIVYTTNRNTLRRNFKRECKTQRGADKAVDNLIKKGYNFCGWITKEEWLKLGY